MQNAIVMLSLVMSYFWVVQPLLVYRRQRAERRYYEAFENYKLRMVRRYYPELHTWSFDEIKRTIDVDMSYDNIGRF